MEKVNAYQELVQFRKQYHFENKELTNPSSTSFDTEEIEPWAQWQNNLDAKILLIGQEFCDLKTYNDDRGKIEVKDNIYKYPSNRNLHDLFLSIGIEIGHPLNPNRKASVFFTNAVMGLKDGSMSSNFKDKWVKESRERFIIPLIKIIQPEIIITLGTKAMTTVSTIYNIPVQNLKTRVLQNPIITENNIKFFAFYHPGKLGTINRPFEIQKDDWQNIKPFLK